MFDRSDGSTATHAQTGAGCFQDQNDVGTSCFRDLGSSFRQNRINACAHSLGLRSLSLRALPVPSFQAAKACTL